MDDCTSGESECENVLPTTDDLTSVLKREGFSLKG